VAFDCSVWKFDRNLYRACAACDESEKRETWSRCEFGEAEERARIGNSAQEHASHRCLFMRNLAIVNFPVASCHCFIIIPVITCSVRFLLDASRYRSRYRRQEILSHNDGRYIVVNALIDGIDLWMHLLINWAITAERNLGAHYTSVPKRIIRGKVGVVSSSRALFRNRVSSAHLLPATQREGIAESILYRAFTCDRNDSLCIFNTPRVRAFPSPRPRAAQRYFATRAAKLFIWGENACRKRIITTLLSDSSW